MARTAAAFLVLAHSVPANAEDFFYRYGALPGWQEQQAGGGANPGGNSVKVVGTGDLHVYGPVQVRARPGTPFALQFTADNAEGAVTWTLGSGTLPDGLTLSPSGLLSGLPGAVGSARGIKVSGIDAAGKRGETLPFTIDVRPFPAVTVAGAPFALDAGQPLAVTPSATDVYGTANWTVRGEIPVGMQVDTLTGRITGSPEQKGSFTNLVLGVVDADGAYGESAPFGIEVASKLSLNGLQARYLGRAGRKLQTVQPYASGTPGPFEWSLASGSLPSGVSLDPFSGTISGTPAQRGESVTASVRVRDTQTRDLIASPPVSFRIGGPPSVAVKPVTYARTRGGITVTPTATDVIGQGAWSLVGALPQNSVLSQSSGTIGGTPYAPGTVSGAILKVIDLFDGATAYSNSFDMVVSPELVVNPMAMPLGKVGVPVTIQPPPVRGLQGAPRWSARGLPPGLAADPATGVASGTPTAAGDSFGVTYAVTDTLDGVTATSPSTSTMKVLAVDAPLPFGIQPLADDYPAKGGKPFRIVPEARGATGTLAWSVNGLLPDWAYVDPSTGTVTGTPTTLGTSGPLNLVVTQSDGTSAASSTFTITVAPGGALSVAVPASLYATQAQAFDSGPSTATNLPAGGAAFTLASGSLPPGMALSPDTGSISGTSPIAGEYPGIVVQVTDSTGGTASTPAFTLRVRPVRVGNQEVAAYMDALVQGYPGQPLVATPATYGLATPQSWTVATGTLPAWASLDPATGTVQGTPDAFGTYPDIALQATDGTGLGARTNLFTLSVAARPTPSAAFVPVIYGRAGQPIQSVAPKASGLDGKSVSWSLGGGTLPDGLSLDGATGTVSGTPSTAVELDGLALTATDSDGVSATTGTFKVSVVPSDAPGIAASVGSPVYATVGRPLAVTPTVRFASGTQTWTLKGTVPSAITLDSATGRLSGTPPNRGTYQGLELDVADAKGDTGATNAFDIEVAYASDYTPAIRVPEASSYGPGGYSGMLAHPFRATPYASKTRGALAWSLVAGTLPAGIAMDPATGVMSGMPTAVGTQKGIVLQVVDAAGLSARSIPFQISIVPIPVLSATVSTPLAGTAGSSFGARPTATGALAGQAWSLSQGTLPAWAKLDPASGAIGGLPTYNATTDGLRLRVTDGEGRTADTDTFSIVISDAPPLQAEVAALSQTTKGATLTVTPKASNARQGASWTLSKGTLPPGFTLDRDSGTVSGVPTQIGVTDGLVLAVTDGIGRSASTAAFTLQVDRPNLRVSLGNATFQTHPGMSIATAAPSVSGAQGTVTWSYGGTLPDGFTFNTNGTFSGSAPAPVTAPLTLTATDGFDGATATSAPVTISVIPTPTVTANPVVYGHEGSFLNYSPKVTNAIGPLTYRLSAGQLPSWASLDIYGRISGYAGAAVTTDGLRITVTDSLGASGTSDPFALTVASAMSAYYPLPVYRGRVGVAFATDAPVTQWANAPVTWAIPAGSALPTWAILRSNGAISGMPDAAGTFQVPVVGTDAQGYTATAGNMSVAIGAAPTVAVADATVREGAPLSLKPSITNAASGGQAWSIVSGTQPSWLVLDQSLSVLRGVAAGQGTTSGLKLKVVDPEGSPGVSNAFSITVTQGLSVSGFQASYGGRQGLDFGPVQLKASNLKGTQSWALSGFPAGLSVSASGVVSGKPTAYGGFASARATVTDASDQATASAATSLAIAPALAVSGLPASVQRHAGQDAFALPVPTVVGQRGQSLEWTVAGTGLPGYASLDGQTGIVTLAATQRSATPSSTSGILVQARDPVDGATASVPLSLQLLAPLGVSDVPTLYTARFGFDFASSAPTAVNAGTGAVTWSWAPGSSPPSWAKVDGATGKITGKPDALGDTPNLQLLVTDSTGATAPSVPFTLRVYSAPAVSLAPATATYKLRVGDTMPAIKATQTGAAGTPAWSIATSGGTCASGLSVDANGNVGGVPLTSVATCTFTVRMTDPTDGFATDSAPVSLSVNPTLTVSGLKPSYRVHQFSQISTDPPVITGAQGSGGVTVTLDPFVPEGMTFNDAQHPNVLSGVPSKVFGTTTFTLTATDGYDGRKATTTFTLASLAALTATGQSDLYLRNGADIASYSFTPSAGNALDPAAVQWSLLNGTLPDGVTVKANGSLTGVPGTAYASMTSFTGLSLLATDSDGSSQPTASFQVQVGPQPTVSADAQTATEGQSFSYTPVANNLFAPASTGAKAQWTATGLPGTKLAINASTGAITGTLDGGTGSAGPYTVNLTLKDLTDNATATGSFVLTVTPAPVLALLDAPTLTVQTQTLPNAGPCTNVQVRNTGSAAATGLAMAVTQNAAEFASCAPTTGTACGTTLSAGATCVFGVQLNASTVGTGKTGTLKVTATNYAQSPTLALAGATAGQQALYAFSNHTFTTCGASGGNGPALATCRSAYSGKPWAATYLTMPYYTGYQVWTVPQNGRYTILAKGASGSGGNGSSSGGLGVSMQGDFDLTQGDRIVILVGQAGSLNGYNSSDGSGGGSGGGTFVARVNPNGGYTLMSDRVDPLVVAGGGGGGNDSVYQGKVISGYNASATTGNPGASNGGGSFNLSAGGKSFLSGAGGTAYSRGGSTGTGGFGGGYAQDDNASGGGGYQGGGPSSPSYSYNGGLAQSNGGSNSGQGSVTITLK